jgi:hypothetical protein
MASQELRSRHYPSFSNKKMTQNIALSFYVHVKSNEINWCIIHVAVYNYSWDGSIGVLAPVHSLNHSFREKIGKAPSGTNFMSQQLANQCWRAKSICLGSSSEARATACGGTCRGLYFGLKTIFIPPPLLKNDIFSPLRHVIFRLPSWPFYLNSSLFCIYFTLLLLLF